MSSVQDPIKKIILGTVQLGLQYGVNNHSGVPSADEAVSILDLARDSGIQSLDTAEAYGDSQKKIGGYFSSRGENAFRIFTKFKETEETLAIQLEKTLQELHCTQAHCYSFHRFSDLQNQGLVKQLFQLKSDKKISLIGVSIYTNEELSIAIECDFLDVIQLPFNLLDNWSKRGDLIKKAKAKGKEIHVRSVFLQGLFYQDPHALASFFRPLSPSLEQIKALAQTFGLTTGQLALRYALSFSEIDGVLIGVEKRAQLEENLKTLEISLPQELWNEISQIQVSDPSLLDPRNWNSGASPKR